MRPHGGTALRLTDLLSIREACLRLAVDTQRELLLFSRDLDPDLYDQVPFLDAVRHLALARPQFPVRVLVFEPLAPVRAGHRLIGLSRRLPSRIAIRRVAEDFRTRMDAFLISDGTGYCLRRLADRHAALVEWRAPGAARRLRADFDAIWEHSNEDIELRRIDL
ncbi:hypothetical protein THSYN_10430 [Candidatus Thiodictyon syntrophicum]|uniref:DUF7931 domain-containing protein n=1 Tax=Candidatus Thiodictyon syntrophicum TaxID=1166950 RepID=A0A2K8UGK0_9GAMM|nr:hypothetical protein THSYN_10430 [Candidatus Thiodictyon syntrophicum]